MDLKLKCFVTKYKSFTRKNGEIGQEIVVRNDNGYSCSLKVVDKSMVDLSGIPTQSDVLLTLVPEFIVVKGDKYFQNILSLKVVGFSDDIVID